MNLTPFFHPVLPEIGLIAGLITSSNGGLMSDRQDVDDQNELAFSLGKIVGSGWSVVFVNCEVGSGREGTDLSVVGFCVSKSFLGKVVRHDLSLEYEQYMLFRKVGEALMRRSSVNALTIDAIVRKDGNFQFFVDYGKPLRLGGDITASDRYLKYLQDDGILSKLARLEGKAPK